VRLVFDNPDLTLKPNMFADVIIYGGPKREVLKIPAEALIVTGERESVVRALGRRPLPAGGCGHRHAARRRGGDPVRPRRPATEIVVSGQFLIDSESNLQASFMRMAEPETASEAASQVAVGDQP
jgi:Cu(I)/Ag(I) efflux system membrane fusion protein